MTKKTTMTDQISVTDTNTVGEPGTAKRRRKLIAYLAAGALLLGGGIALTSDLAANAAAEDTALRCAAALQTGASASRGATISLKRSDAALDAVTSVAIPIDGWTSTDYRARPGTAARASGAELIERVGNAHSTLANLKLPTECAERDEAASITEMVKENRTAAAELDVSVAVVLDDFAVFQSEEVLRIEAVIEAERVAAEAEAARVAAEAEAARAAEAARVAAAQRAAAQKSSSGTQYSGGSGGGGSPAPAPAPRPPSSGGTPGGGQVGAGDNSGPCRTSNGMGGFMPCQP